MILIVWRYTFKLRILIPMNILKRIGLVVLALFLGGIVNMVLVMIGPKIFAIPQGIDISTYDGLKKAVPLFTVENYIFPFLAHALGTLVSAFLAARWLKSKSAIACAVIGILFFIGGLMDVMALNGAMWFNIIDLSIAYLPMAYLGWRLGSKSK